MLLGHAGVGHYDAHANAMGRLAHMVQAQAAVMSYIDLYWFLTVGTAIMFFLSFLLKKNDPRAGGHVVVH
jgi:DHA2 family multidrug resistance protein